MCVCVCGGGGGGLRPFNFNPAKDTRITVCVTQYTHYRGMGFFVQSVCMKYLVCKVQMAR